MYMLNQWETETHFVMIYKQKQKNTFNIILFETIARKNVFVLSLTVVLAII